jgi:hypothetical protein
MNADLICQQVEIAKFELTGLDHDSVIACNETHFYSTSSVMSYARKNSREKGSIGKKVAERIIAVTNASVTLDEIDKEIIKNNLSKIR